MGVLRDNAGVLGGIGQALSQLGANKREERLMALQSDRQMALQRMQNEFAAGENQKGRDLTAAEGGKNRQVQVGQLGLERDKLDANISEGAKDRASAEKIAGIRADATRKAAGARGNKSRWAINKAASESLTKDGGMSKVEEIVITDKDKGRTYKQQGDIFLPQGAPPPAKKAHRSEIAKLVENPEASDQFFKTYGYLPMEWFGAIQSQVGEEETAPDEEE